MPETLTPAAPTITELFEQAVTRWADRVAFRVKDDGAWREITFAEYADDVRMVAGGMMALGIEPGSFGAIMAGNSPKWHIADFGMINAGIVTCPVYPTSAPAQVQYILEHSDAAVVVVADEVQRAKVEAVRADLPHLRHCVVMNGEGTDGDTFYLAWDSLLERGREHLEQHPEEYDARRLAAQHEDLLSVIYTSGTTGPPKGTMLSHRNAVFTLASLDSLLEAELDDRKLSFLPLSHVAERTSSEYLQLQQGFEIWFGGGIDTLREDLPACKPTIQFVVPRVLEKQHDGIRALLASLPEEQRTKAEQAIALGVQRVRLAQQGQSLPEHLEAAWKGADGQLFAMARAALGYDQIRMLICGAAPIALELLEFFNAMGVRLIEVYGQTEDHGPSTINRLDRWRLGTVGYAIDGGEIRLLDDGEILYRGPNVCMGYYKNPEATAELIDADGWMHSGDIGTIDEDGFLRITDRKKEIIITASGKNIAPQVIEQKLKFNPWVSQAVVIGDGRRYVTALITLDEQSVRQFAEQKSIAFGSFAELSQHPDIVQLVDNHVQEVNTELSGPEQVKRFTILPEDLSVEAGTITPTLKIRRKPIAERYAEDIAALYPA